MKREKYKSYYGNKFQKIILKKEEKKMAEITNVEFEEKEVNTYPLEDEPETKDEDNGAEKLGKGIAAVVIGGAVVVTAAVAYGGVVLVKKVIIPAAQNAKAKIQEAREKRLARKEAKKAAKSSNKNNKGDQENADLNSEE